MKKNKQKEGKVSKFCVYICLILALKFDKDESRQGFKIESFLEKIIEEEMTRRLSELNKNMN